MVDGCYVAELPARTNGSTGIFTNGATPQDSNMVFSETSFRGTRAGGSNLFMDKFIRRNRWPVGGDLQFRVAMPNSEFLRRLMTHILKMLVLPDWYTILVEDSPWNFGGNLTISMLWKLLRAKVRDRPVSAHSRTACRQTDISLPGFRRVLDTTSC